jgi:hypothetical protein
VQFDRLIRKAVPPGAQLHEHTGGNLDPISPVGGRLHGCNDPTADAGFDCRSWQHAARTIGDRSDHSHSRTLVDWLCIQQRHGRANDDENERERENPM